MQFVRCVQLHPSPLINQITHLSKLLYNVALYTVRQEFFSSGKWIRYYELWQMTKFHPVYQQMHNYCGSHPPQQVLKQVDYNFKSFFNALKDWKRRPLLYKTCPKIPSYKKKNSRCTVIFTSQQCRIRKGYLYLTRKMQNHGFPLIKTDLLTVDGVRIVPFGDRYNIEMIYKVYPENLHLDPNHILGIDLGLNNIVAASDNHYSIPLIIKGGVIKSVNQYFNKKLALFKSISKKCNDVDITNRIKQLFRKRNNKIRDIFHKISRRVIEHCVDFNIGLIIIGYNKGWKQNIHLGKKNNQSFVSVPFFRLVSMIEYKAEMLGIKVQIVTEEYTSQTCSNCGIVRKSNRKHRGLYVCNKCDMVLNADVNACCNIVKKGVPQTVWLGDRGCLDHPKVLSIL